MTFTKDIIRGGCFRRPPSVSGSFFLSYSLSWVLLLTIISAPACGQWSPQTTSVVLRPTTAHIAHGKNTFTLILENPDSSRWVQVYPHNLRVTDNIGISYTPSPFATPEPFSKTVLPNKTRQIQYVLERSIAPTATTLFFTLDGLFAQQEAGPDQFPLPALRWEVNLSTVTTRAGIEDTPPILPNAKPEEDLGSMLVARVENLRRGCRGFDLVFENKARDRTFALAVIGLTIQDDTGKPYDLDTINMPDYPQALVQRKALLQALLRIKCVLTRPIEAKAQDVTFSLENVSATLDGGQSYPLHPLRWKAQPRNATRQEITQDKERWFPDMVKRAQEMLKGFEKQKSVSEGRRKGWRANNGS